MLTPRENALMAYRHQQPAWIPCFYTDIAMTQARPEMERFLGYDGGPPSGTDGFGVEWTYEPTVHAPMVTPGKVMFTDVTEWKKYVKFPNLEAIDWEAQAAKDVTTDFQVFVMGGGIVPFADGSSIHDTNKLKLCMVINGMFERLHSLIGMKNVLESLLLEPEACSEFFSAMADYKIKYFEKIAKYYNVDVINAHDDYGSNDRLFMSPSTWRELIKPHLKRIVDAVHDMGLIYQHHSCGYIEPLMPDFIEIGIDAIDTLQACNKNLPELKKQYGDRITFCGGFDNMGVLDVPGVTEDAIRKEYRRVIDSLAPGGSYVIFPIGASFNFVRTFLDEHFKYGMGFYNK